ncbi:MULTISPECIES: hypothetical protein [Burkholderia]|uniref:hypothetical protein n=1 Tax=Burkholderia TaxID=32008 RepID=UPI00158BE006|nr:hypothetical protein [Burkholderia cepacia]MCA8053515.1 hypothetical protein [Burkholderia cepacia]MCA8132179.1 hypothetical protein [Burkholderia cepacia]MCA8160033.1 hypothetical protein [Burkholderia cepacia]HEM7892525.1 hypothetical protein [Burkholderia cepacia]HEM7895984.1 hypothetical protein [Burkholderia cepacia]
MKREILCALACGMVALPACAAADLDAVLLHESRTVTADGVTRTTLYRERMVRRDGHVWVERVLPAAAAGGGQGDDHDHDAGPGRRAGVQPAAAHAGHRHFNFQAAARHVTYDGKTARIEYVDAANRTVVSVPPAEYETTGFDGSWDNAYYVTPPSQLKWLAVAKRGDAPGTLWYEQAVDTPGARGVNRILWSETLQAPLSVEYRSADGRVVRKLTLTPAPAARREPPPWTTLARYARKEYADYLD